MKELVKLLRNMKMLKKERNSLYKYIYKHQNLINPKKTTKNKIKLKTKILTKGNIEFFSLFSLVSLGLYYIHLKRFETNESVRLIAAGITSHILVDYITYLGDKINTKVKVDKFLPVKKKSTNDLNYLFEKTFTHFDSSHKRKRKHASGTLSYYLQDFKLRGIQASILYVVFNSIIFYGLYKNLKYYLNETFGISGFFNFFIAAGISQFFGMLFAFPLENLKTRMQASNFNYDSLVKYYRKVFFVRRRDTLFKNIRNEYSGFNSHLLLYVVYESVTFAIYESLMRIYQNKEQIQQDNKNINEVEQNVAFEHNDNSNSNHVTHEHHEVNFKIVAFSSIISGIIAASITNPIDVYQINKQMNPKFSISLLNPKNIFTGIKERIYYITLVNLTTFLFLESIGPKYFNVRLE